MFRVVCDKCGDGNDFGEYWAWNDRSCAIDCWIDSSDLVLDDGRAYHRECVPKENCPELDVGEWHTWGSDGTCGEECGRTVAEVFASVGGQP